MIQEKLDTYRNIKYQVGSEEEKKVKEIILYLESCLEKERLK